jgi:hypothetical protein
MKQLFVCAGVSFEKKEEAKTFADECEHQGHKRPKVSIGPDHWRFGVKGHPRTNSHNARGLNKKVAK